VVCSIGAFLRLRSPLQSDLSAAKGGNDTLPLMVFAAPPTSSVSDYQRHLPTQSVLVTIHLLPHSFAFGLPMPAFLYPVWQHFLRTCLPHDSLKIQILYPQVFLHPYLLKHRPPRESRKSVLRTWTAFLQYRPSRQICKSVWMRKGSLEASSCRMERCGVLYGMLVMRGGVQLRLLGMLYLLRCSILAAWRI